MKYKIVINWPLALVTCVFIVATSSAWTLLVLTHTIPPTMPSWLVAAIGSGSFMTGVLIPAVQWLQAHVVSEHMIPTMQEQMETQQTENENARQSHEKS
jgi:hypothetical protein